jgi:MoaA/NifB/PqqE/SkfB family radical SAM enzyme
VTVNVETASPNTGIWHLPIWADGASRDDGYRTLKDLNSALLQQDMDRGSTFFRGLPEVVMLNHTNICNLRCVMCPRHDIPGDARLDRGVLEVLASRLFRTARKVGLAAAQAEPMAVDFEFLIESARRFGVRVDVTTNATLLTVAAYRAARGVIDHLDVSLDSHVPETYESIRIGARFDQVYANLCALRDERARVADDVLFTISAVVMTSNLEHLPGLVRFAKRLGAVGLILKKLNSDVKATPEADPELHWGRDRVCKVLRTCREVALEERMNLLSLDSCAISDDAISVNPLPTRLPLKPQSIPRNVCWYLAHNFHVQYTGEVYPCIVPTPYVAGNVLRDDPIAIWNAPVLRGLRAAHFSRKGNSFCSGCSQAPHLPKGGLLQGIERKAALLSKRVGDLLRS